MNPVLPGHRAAQLAVAPGADFGEARLLQPLGQLLHGVAPLAVQLEAAVPGSVLRQGEQVHIIGAQPPPILGAPDAVGILRLVQKHLPVQSGQPLRQPHIKGQQPTGTDEQVQPPKGTLHIPGIREIIQAVQTADGGVHGAVQVQPGHGLVQKQRRHLCRSVFLPGGGQHLLGPVHGNELIPPSGQQPGHGPGAAGQIQHRMHRDAAAAEQLFQKVRPLFIAHVPGQLVIGPGQLLVAAHFSSCSFMRSRTFSYPPAPLSRDRFTRLMVALDAPVFSRISL